MQEKTITGMNFVRFMHEVVSAVESGYTLTLEPQHAPVGYPNYSVTLVQLQEDESLSVQEKAILQEVVNETKEEVPAKEVPNTTKESPVEEAPKKQQGRPARK